MNTMRNRLEVFGDDLSHWNCYLDPQTFDFEPLNYRNKTSGEGGRNDDRVHQADAKVDDIVID